ncbi:MAG: GTP-binding protein [Acidimicrobiales bacterium]
MPYQEPDYLPWDGRRVPITFVGGYLGAGKTTAINAVLAQADQPVAVIVNDVGAVNIDAALIRRRHGDTIELTNGCICCSSIEEMGAAFDLLRSRATPPDHVLVELSGVAEPERMLPWGASAGFALDGLVVVVGADQLTAEDDLPDWVRAHLRNQVSAADLLLLSRTDLVDPAAVDRARAELGRLAPGTPVYPAGPDQLGTGAVGRFLALGGRAPAGPPAGAVQPSLFDAHRTCVVPIPVGLERAALAAWLDAELAGADGTVVRAKGVAHTVDHGPVLIQVVGRRRELDPLPGPERQPATDLVVITLPGEG